MGERAYGHRPEVTYRARVTLVRTLKNLMNVQTFQRSREKCLHQIGCSYR
jgi:hypothetical protein